MSSVISVSNLNKIYKSGLHSLKNINLDIQPGEIFALLGPNGAGKTTLISIICGLTTSSSGTVHIREWDINTQYRQARQLIGLVPQEITVNMFETVWDTVNFSRSLFGLPYAPSYVETLLKDLSLWDKRNSALITLSGGMKRRVMIAKALSHEPQVLFLDEPTAGVDVELRKDMWAQINHLRESGVTIILTTHYIEEAENMADRIGIINKGEIILVEDKTELIKKMGYKRMRVELTQPIRQIPAALAKYNLAIEQGDLIYQYDSKQEETGIFEFLETLKADNITFHDLHIKQSSLEDIFVELVKP